MASVGQIAVGRHEYGLKGGQKALYLLIAVMLGAGAVAFYPRTAGDPNLSVAIASFALLAAVAVYMALLALRSRLVIDGTRIQVQGPLRLREFDLSQVEGYRTYKSRYQSFRVLCLKDGAGKIRLMQYAKDQALEDWFAGLTDLDQQDRDQLMEKIDQNQELGATPEERRSALTRAKGIAIAAWIVDGVAAAAFALGPAQYRLAAMVAVVLAPMVAAFLLYRQPLLYVIFKGKKDPRAEVSPLLLISGLGLMLGADSANFVSMSALLPYIGFAALALLVIFFQAARNSQRFVPTLLLLCVLTGLYGWGLAAAADTVPDRSAPRIFSVLVLGRHISQGSRSTSYYLNLAPWGPYETSDNQMEVDWSVYHATQPGDSICIALRPGALYVAWYRPVPCGSDAP